MDIEARLRQAIETADATRYRLSMLSGIDQATLSRFVHGERSLTLPTAQKLAEALGLDIIITPRQTRKGR
jgi:plasmid maintenance system antidote protein VapI